MGSTETIRRQRKGALDLAGLRVREVDAVEEEDVVGEVDSGAVASRVWRQGTERYLTVLSTAPGGSEERLGRLPRARALARSGHGGQGDGEARGDLPGGGEGKGGTEVDEGN